MITKTKKNHVHFKRTGNTFKSLYQQGVEVAFLYCLPVFFFMFNFHLNLFHTFLHSRLSESGDANQIVVPVVNKSRVFIRFVIVKNTRV